MFLNCLCIKQIEHSGSAAYTPLTCMDSVMSACGERESNGISIGNFHSGLWCVFMSKRMWVGPEMLIPCHHRIISLSSSVALGALSGSPVFINVFQVFKDHSFSYNLTPNFKETALSCSQPKNSVG